MKFTFKIIDGNLHEYDANGNEIHYKDSDGYESWWEYDSNGTKITKEEFDKIHAKPTCEGKIVEVDGVKYKLKKV